ncbi:MAG: hypothetical protein QG566_524 [Patescibacteria group bacterium]|nr:hypothetical protein [Patescibacteria group bacterium]
MLTIVLFVGGLFALLKLNVDKTLKDTTDIYNNNENENENESNTKSVKTYISSKLGISFTYPEKINFVFGSPTFGNEAQGSLSFMFREEGNKLYIIGDIKEEQTERQPSQGDEYFIEFFSKKDKETFKEAIENQFLKGNKICFVDNPSKDIYVLSLIPEEAAKFEIGDSFCNATKYGDGYFSILSSNRYMFVQSSGQEPYFGQGDVMEFWPPVLNKNLKLQ